MTTLTAKHFDVLDYIEKAEKLGITNEVAKFQARQIEQAIEVAISSIEGKELALKSDIIAIELALKSDIVAAELRLIKWILGTGIGGLVIIAGMLKYMVH